MELPTMPRRAKQRMQAVKRSEEIIEFRGLNRTENTRNGELKHAVNLSTANYPCISQRGKRVAVTQTGEYEYDSPTDIFEWDGHFVAIDQGGLYYDGVWYANVMAGKKQFAVINTKLCVWPDKLYIDMTNNTLGYLNARAETTGTTNSVEFTGSTLKANLKRLVSQDLMNAIFGGNATLWNPGTYTYGTDVAAVEACYVNGAWDMTALAALKKNMGFFTRSGANITFTQGEIFIPEIDNGFRYIWANFQAGETVDTTKYNSNGYYGVFTCVDPDEVSIYPSETHFGPHYDIYQTGIGNPLFSDLFQIGDSVDVSGTPNGVCDVQRAIIRNIDSTTNTLTFDLDTFDVPSSPYTISSVVTIERDVPDLDYICEKDNRLWGVSNSLQNEVYNPQTESVEIFTSRAIYASALGDPTNWWVFDGVDTDSYQVAVGSEGDFTGICSFGGGVCCWKEHQLHKIVGSYPSEYYMNDSRVEGVAAGSSRSLTVVNETLYYNGASGVYAYSGGIPSLIGYELGEKLSDACGGTDGKRWYLSGTRSDGEKELLVYDLTHRLWMREDDTEATSFAVINGALHFLADGVIYKAEQGADEDICWLAEFTTFTETEIVKKYYLRLALRLDMSAGSSITVEVREDFGEWHTVHTADITAQMTKVVNLPVKRCDRFDVRISGTGNVLIRAMTREYVGGSER